MMASRAVVVAGVAGLALWVAGSAVAQEATAVSRMKRDPFRPFTVSLRRSPDRPLTPLERIDVGALNLVAVIWNMSSPRAMVEDDSGVGYSLSVGTKVGQNGGVVKSIEPDRVVVVEEYEDLEGEKRRNEFVLKLKQTEGEKRP
jgi:type IV pilus assembly protein PilP